MHNGTVADGDDTRHLWWWIFGALCVLIVTLVASIVTVNVVNNGRRRNYADENAIREEVGDEFILADGSVGDAYINDIELTVYNLGFDEGVAFYEDIINKKSDDVENILNLRISYAYYLLNNEQNDASLEQLNLIDESRLDVQQKLKLYGAYYNYYMRLGDENMADEYNRMSVDLARENGINEDGE